MASRGFSTWMEALNRMDASAACWKLYTDGPSTTGQPAALASIRFCEPKGSSEPPITATSAAAYQACISPIESPSRTPLALKSVCGSSNARRVSGAPPV